MAMDNTINMPSSTTGEAYNIQPVSIPSVKGKTAECTSTGNQTSTEKEFIAAIEKANQLQKGTTECQFSIHEDTKQVMIKIIDTMTKEIIREIPSEKILDMFATMCEVNGLFVDEKR